MAYALQFIRRGLDGSDGVAISQLGAYVAPFLEPLYGVQVHFAPATGSTRLCVRAA